jgi:hypothetical protein
MSVGKIFLRGSGQAEEVDLRKARVRGKGRGVADWPHLDGG